MLSVWVLALCVLISGGISEDDVEETSTTNGELEETNLITLLSGPVFNYSETNPELQNYQDAWKVRYFGEYHFVLLKHKN
uniref:Putative lipocalin n=1 Tax=Ixodes ricinus TaxID=34613 RepID=A0A6B0TVG5_IXORI